TFREHTGVSPARFLGALRIEAAKRLLIETDDSILDICLRIGYSSLGSFSTRFTQMVGLSPGRYRQLGQSFYRHLAALLHIAASPGARALPPAAGRAAARGPRRAPEPRPGGLRRPLFPPDPAGPAAVVRGPPRPQPGRLPNRGAARGHRPPLRRRARRRRAAA